MAVKKLHGRELATHWRAKLERAGFDDIEDAKGNLRQHDRRTIGFENRELISEFFRKLDHYLTDHPEVPRLHRLILSMWSDGADMREICKKSKRCNSWVRTIIRRYRNMLLGMQ